MTSQKLINRRFGDDPSLHSMILFSVFIHAIILSVIFFLPSIPSPKLTFGPVYSVQLVSFSETFLRGKDISSASGEFSDRPLSDRSSILKKQADSVPSPAVKKTEIQRQDFSGVEKAVEKIRQGVSSPAAEKNQPDDAGNGARMNRYYAMLWARIKSQWILPQSILPRENIEAVVHAKILRNGAVTDVSLEKRSGNRYFDESAMKAVRKANPLPPLPEWARGSSMEIGVRFHSSDLR